MHHCRPEPDPTPEDHHVGPDFKSPIEDHPLWQRENVTLRSVDLGRMRHPSGTVSVAIQSLLFHDVLQHPYRNQRIHHKPQHPLED